MKARASNLMIGSMTLAVIAAAFVGLLGYRKIHGIAQRGQLRIVFEGSASGLRKGGSVNFDGIQVGEIKSLKLDNPRKVVALVTLDEDGIPILTADLTETQSIRDTLHNVDRILVGNQAVVKDALVGFQTYTAT